MTTEPVRHRNPRLERAVEDLTRRVEKIERVMWWILGAATSTGGVALFNLLNNLSGGKQ